ncbi:glycosyltransferase family 2 protein [Agarilytica rhodophyticola]|uniref:glycosyltransferase family 2 protein n=1 Tax=Agarilytica rhodophyticola TaxID=1737490 RepID=UPI000B3463F7|nr:glycosyltransferase family 2 protein [Agarilytica rhodophyticola]
MKIAVSILNYRTPELTIDAIKATITALEYREKNDWRILVVDNDSQDGSEEQLQKVVEENKNTAGWQNIEVLQTGHNGGFGAGNNYAIQYAREKFAQLEYVYVLNSDAFPDQDAIKVLIDFLDQNTHYGFAGSYIYGTDGTPHETAFRFPSPLGEFEGAVRFGPISKLLKKYQVPLGLLSTSCDVDWLAGASMLMRIKTLEEVGVFDETFFLYFEETDLCLRAQRKGWPVRYILESKVAHIGSASTGMKKWDRIPAYWLDSRRHYFKKNHGSLQFALATFLRTIGSTLYNLRCVIEKKENTEPSRFIRDMLKHALASTSSKS